MIWVTSTRPPPTHPSWGDPIFFVAKAPKMEASSCGVHFLTRVIYVTIPVLVSIHGRSWCIFLVYFVSGGRSSRPPITS